MDNLKQKSFRAFAWDLTGKLADQGIGFFISIILARLLMPSEFGLIAMAMVVISLASVLIDSGLGVALIQRKELTNYHYGSVFYFNMVAGTFLTILFFFLSGYIADFYNRPELKAIMQALSFSFIIDSFTRVQAAWLTKQLKFGVLTKARIAALITSGITGVSLAFAGYGVWALVWQTLANGIIRNLYINFFSGFNFKYKFSFDALKELWGFGFRMFISGIIARFVEQADNLIIGKIFTPATLGFYSRAKSLNQFVIKYTSSSLMSVIFPVLSSIQNDKERYNKIVYKSFHVLNLITFFLIGYLFINVKDIVVILLTSKWLPSVQYFKILLLAGYGYPFSALLVNIISSKGNSKVFLKLEIVKQSFFALNLLFGFYWGITGYLYINVFVVLIAVILNIRFASMEMNVNSLSFYKVIFPYLFLTIVIIPFILMLDKIVFYNMNIYLHFIVLSTVFISVYLFFVVILKLKGFTILLKEIRRNEK